MAILSILFKATSVRFTCCSPLVAILNCKPGVLRERSLIAGALVRLFPFKTGHSFPHRTCRKRTALNAIASRETTR